MKAALNIRRARGKDAAALTNVILRSKQSNGYDDAFMAACADELSVTPEQIAADIFWMAEEDTPLGCVCLAIDATTQEGHIKTFFIAPEAKRKGIGRSLWQAALKSAVEHDLKRLTLDSDPAAVSFYEAMGFRTFCDVPSGSIVGRMLPQMELMLDRT